eukprot:scaffold3272_cov59-Cylindrotheca_fusiformis.AAC.2
MPKKTASTCFQSVADEAVRVESAKIGSLETKINKRSRTSIRIRDDDCSYNKNKRHRGSLVEDESIWADSNALQELVVQYGGNKNVHSIELKSLKPILGTDSCNPYFLLIVGGVIGLSPIQVI